MTLMRDRFPTGLRDLTPEVLDTDGRMKILPARFWATTTRAERFMFGSRHGIYAFPTVELVDYLRGVIADRSAIEIGAGNGVLAEALNIPATDSRQQERPTIRHLFDARDQVPVTYGPNVVTMHALKAVRTYEPDIAIGCWVTHKYEPVRHAAGGNEDGVDEEELLRGVGLYVFIGNTLVHQDKKIWKRRHTIIYPDWLYSRAMNQSREFIAIWRGDRPRPMPRRQRDR